MNGQERTPFDDVDLVVRATAFAADKHRHQRRKDRDASPYINHPIALAAVLSHEARVHDPIVLAAALLHDTLEDTETSPSELEQHFGVEVAGIVQEVTDDKSLAKAERKRLQIVHAPRIGYRAKLVKLADKICNLRDINAMPPQDWSIERKREYFDWAKRVADGLRGANEVLERLFDAEYLRRP